MVGRVALMMIITITGHGITAEWVLETFLLDVVPVHQDETGVFLAESITEVLDSWNIEMQRVVCITTDGAANIRNAVEEELKMPWVYCSAHAVNLAIRLSLDHALVKPLVLKAKLIAKFFKNSPKASRILADKQRELHLSVLKLKADNNTRWGSAHEMLERLWKSRSAVTACLARRWNTRRKVPDDLTTEEWKALHELGLILRALKDGSEFLSSQRNPTIGSVMPVLYTMIYHHLVDIPFKKQPKMTLRIDGTSL
eukprot:TRINITY_DN2201_c0_g1_i2.p2 TRINITY_DN2201_c0_g1~~TRINITY_DN2201_c0_g1_i2.p2  ORF type:complete len:255 (+),score=34.84 TRINITY_DN2201_c0_g1_i2:188-952(+)